MSSQINKVEKLISSILKKRAFRDVLKSYDLIRELNISSLVLAIQMNSQNKQKIILRGQPEMKVSSSFRGAMLTQEFSALMVGCAKPVKMYEHFVYYSNRLSIQQKRFCILHELGHIALHIKKTKKQRQYMEIDTKDINETLFFTMQYSEEEEAEADLFASFFLENEHKTEDRILSLEHIKLLKKKGLLTSKVGSMLPMYPVRR